MRRKTRRQRKRLLKTFEKGTGLRKSLKRALKDKKFNRRDAKKLTIKGANLKQLEKIRTKSNKLSRFKVDNKINTRQRLKSTFRNTNNKRFSDDTPIRDFRIDKDAPSTGGEYVKAPEKEKEPKAPTAGQIDEGLKIGELDPGSTPEGNLETLASNSNVEKFAGDMSGTLAEQAAAADMTIEQFKEKMNDPAYRMRVKGIRFADRGTGGMTRSQLARRGTTGVFGRSGLRIQSLNI
tara:strand:- start:1367 stop:2074 length:708 start_codon:yes stop_codon:yes gene_type:complete